LINNSCNLSNNGSIDNVSDATRLPPPPPIFPQIAGIIGTHGSSYRQFIAIVQPARFSTATTSTVLFLPQTDAANENLSTQEM